MAEAPGSAEETALVPLHQHMTAVTEDRGLTETQDRIYKFLSENGAQRALDIAKQIGKQTRKDVNADLYALKKKCLIFLEKNTKLWSVCGQSAEETALIPLSQHMTAVTEDRGLTETQDRIYKILSENGAQRALDIAKQIGKQTRKDVNADLYALEKKCLIFLEKNTKLWSVCGQSAGYKATNPGPNRTLGPVVIQNNPINIICQTGAQNTVLVADSKATQIGNYNSLILGDTKDDYRPRAPSFEAASENVNTLHCEANAKATAKGGQEINVTESTLKNTVIGNDNQMNVVMKDSTDSPEEHLDQDSVRETTPLHDFTCAGARLSLEIVSTSCREERTPAQRVSIDKSELANVMIGNNNQMSVHKQGDSDGLPDEQTSEEDDGSDPNLTSEQSARTSCGDSSLDGPLNISILCEKLNDIIIGNNNYMNVVETADTGSDDEHEEE